MCNRTNIRCWEFSMCFKLQRFKVATGIIQEMGKFIKIKS
jgi:hypothetical protein